MTSAWIGLGSNLGASLTLLREAVARLAEIDVTRVEAISPVYRTPPWGVVDQPDFINAVVGIETSLEPRLLLDHLLRIEHELGRTRHAGRWGARLIDLDLLVYGDRQFDEPGLTLPHPHLHERAFVLVPLNDLAPKLDVPGRGLVATLLSRLDSKEVAGVRKITDPNGSDILLMQREAS